MKAFPKLHNFALQKPAHILRSAIRQAQVSAPNSAGTDSRAKIQVKRRYLIAQL